MLTSFQLPPGQYYIGDPCYVVSETWDELCESGAFDENELIEFNGFTVWGHHTAYGDGSYSGTNGIEYPVDSGVLAAIPVELIDNPSGEESGTMVDAPTGLIVEYNNGTFHFGNICIHTGDNADEDSYDDEYDFEDDLEF